jgi:hypothetical protein
MEDYRLDIMLTHERLLGANQLNKLHWSKRHRIAKRLKRDVWATTQGKRPVKPLDRATVMITSHRKSLLDPDNLVAGCKPYIDALVTNGVLVDDTPANVCLKIHQAKSKRGYAVQITVIAGMQSELP